MATITDFAQKMLRGEAPPPPIGRLLGFALKAIESGRAVLQQEAQISRWLMRRRDGQQHSLGLRNTNLPMMKRVVPAVSSSHLRTRDEWAWFAWIEGKSVCRWPLPSESALKAGNRRRSRSVDSSNLFLSFARMAWELSPCAETDSSGRRPNSNSTN